MRRNGGSLILLPPSIEDVNMGLGGSVEDDEDGEDDKDDDVDGYGDNSRQKKKKKYFIFSYFLLDLSSEMIT